jgi:transposase
VVAALEPIRVRFRGQKLAAMLNTAAKLGVQSAWDVETTSTVVALRTLARRAHAMSREARELQKAILAIIRGWRPDLLEEFGVGPIVAATVLCAWSHPGRVHSEAAFAMLAGVAQIPANSGQVTTRYRLNRHGDRHLNTALHTVVQIRIQYQPATRDYVARRTAEGKTSREIKRCLARYVARDLYRLLEKSGRSGLTKHRSVAPCSVRGCGWCDRRRHSQCRQRPGALGRWGRRPLPAAR